MEPERVENSHRRLAATMLPKSVVDWLSANDVQTLQELVGLRLDQIESLEAFRRCLLAPLCLMALIEGVSIGGMSEAEMKGVIAEILGQEAEDPFITLMQLDGYQICNSTRHPHEVSRYFS